MEKTFLKTGGLPALFCLLFAGLSDTASAQGLDASSTGLSKDDAGVVTTVTKVLETDEDDATITMTKGKGNYKFYVGKKSGSSVSWTLKENKPISNDTGSGATMPPKKQTLTSKGSFKIKVELTLEPGAEGTLSKGKI